MLNEANFEQIIHEHLSATTFVVAFSGGLDSLVLLYLLKKLKDKNKTQIFPNIKVIHINHQLSKNADLWEKHCFEIARMWQLEFFSEQVKINLDKEQNIEEKARVMRYQAFSRYIGENDVLLTAHHQDDQAETILLHLFRSSNVHGLQGMKMQREFGLGQLFRPLLNFTRLEILNFAEKENLKWIEDESNMTLKFSRNYLRHQVIPLIQERWNSFSKNVLQTAKLCEETSTILYECAKEDLMEVSDNVSSINPRVETLICRYYDDKPLSISKILQYSTPRQKNLLYFWLKEIKPNSKVINKILSEICYAKEDRLPKLKLANFIISRYQNKLFKLPEFIFNKLEPSPEFIINSKNNINFSLFPFGSIVFTKNFQYAHNKKNLINIPNAACIKIDFRRGGEKFKLPGHKKHHFIKNIFQEWFIPPWIRDKIPLIYINNELAAIADLCVSEDYSPLSNLETCFSIEWQFSG